MKNKRSHLLITGLIMLISSGLILNSSLSSTFLSTWAQLDEAQVRNDTDERKTQALELAKKLRETKGVKVPNQYIVVLKDSSLASKNIRTLVDDAKSQGAVVRHVYEHAIKGYAIRIPNEQVLDAILKSPRVDYVQPDTQVKAFLQTLPTGVNRVDGDLSTTKSGDGVGSVDVDIAVLDTGIDLNHPDLNVYKHTTFVAGTSSGNDDQGHGTKVAGVAGAKDDSQGVVGLSPGARLWSVKVLDRNGQGFTSDIIAGIDYVTNNAASIEVVNLSFGGPGTDSALHTAIINSVKAGVTYVAAAGNEKADAGSFVPASFSEVIAVSAISDSDGKCGNGDIFASFSNYGSVIDLAAPGVSIKTTSKGGATSSFDGTSASAPHVTGAAALYIALHPDVTPSDVRTALRASGSVPSTVCDGKGHGYFDGDRDSIAEPLLYMASSGGGGSTPVDKTPPTILSTTPASAAKEVSVTSSITAKFSEKVQGNTVTTSTVNLKNSAGASIAGTVSLGTDEVTATFKPSSSLAFSTSYTVTISPSSSASVKDLPGNDMAAKSWSFTTAAAPATSSSCGSNLPISSATASSSQSSFVSSKAIDNNINTMWWSTFSDKPWIKADLGTLKTVCSVAVTWGDTRQYSFVISVSTDGTSFTNVFTGKSKGTSTTAPEKYSFPDKQGRYVKLTITQSHVGATNSITKISEIDIFGGPAGGGATATATGLSTDSDSTKKSIIDSQSQTEHTTDPFITENNESPTTSPTNHSPLAKDDRVSSESNKQILVKVLGNDRDPDGDELTIVSVSSPTKNGGTVTIEDNGTMTFVPATDFTGVDTFSYEVSDGKGKSDKAKASVIVKPVIVVDSKSDKTADRQTENSKKQQTGGEDNVQVQNQPHSVRPSDDDRIEAPNQVQNSVARIINETNNNVR